METEAGLRYLHGKYSSWVLRALIEIDAAGSVAWLAGS